MVAKAVFEFLERNLDPSRPVLLALSGGPDSLALFYLLLEFSKKMQLAVAHVDHRWREESTEEANLLKKIVTSFQIPFHLKTLDPASIRGNAEEFCRLERLQFFSELSELHNYQAVLLGHHADDQAETVLKKVFEGCQLAYLGGMTSLSTYQGLNIWRPLLSSTKKEILEWLRLKGIQAFEDRTNLDVRYLRGRFRTNIIPYLSNEFGKGVQPTLCRIGEEASELRQYLDDQIKEYIIQIQRGPFGSLLDLSSSFPQSDFELKYLIKKVAELENIRIPHLLLKEACQKIRSKAANCQLLAKNLVMLIDRGRLFILSKRPISWESEPIDLIIGKQKIGLWEVDVREVVNSPESTKTGWKAVWQGQMCLYLPNGNYQLRRADQRLDKEWTDAKVPAFLRWVVPIICSYDQIIHEFLTPKNPLKNESNDPNNKASSGIKKLLININVCI